MTRADVRRFPILLAAIATLALAGAALALLFSPVHAQEGPGPATPTGLSATASHDRVVLTWNDPQDDTITGYLVLRADTVDGAPGEFVAIASDTGSTGTTYTDTTVEPEQSYVYRVHAISPLELSAPSPDLQVDTPAAPDPADLAPANLAAELVDGGVSLRWDAPAQDADPVTGYKVLRARGEDEFTILAADTGNTTTAHTDETADAPGESYAYRVKALRGQEKSQSSNEAVIQLPDPPSSAPGGLTAQYGSSGVVLAWNAPAEDAGAVTGYEILRAEGDGERTILVADTGNTVTTYTDATATQASATYAYRVRAIRDEEKSADSNEARVHLPPSAPLQVLSTATHVSVVLLWADPQDPAIVGYRILRREPAADDPGEFAVLTENTGSATTSYTDTDVAPSTSYAYRVQAISPHGVSGPSRDVLVDTPAVPEPLRTLPAETKQLDGTSDEATVSEPEDEDFPSSTATRGYVAIGESATGEIGRPGDWDAFRVELDSGVTYQIDVKGDATADGTLIDPYLRRLKDADGNNVPGTSNDNANDMLNSQLLFTPEQSGSYYIQIRSATQEGYAATGTYTVSIKLEGAAEEEQTDLLAADSSTILLLGVGDEVTQTIDYFADEDWIKVILTAGTSYAFTVTGGWADDSLTMEIPQVGLFDSESQPLLMYRGDRQATARTQFEGVDGVAVGYHKAEKDGTYYVSVSSRSDVGTYRVSVQEVPESAYHSGSGVGKPHGPEAHYHAPGVVWVREFLAWCPRDMEQGTVDGIPVTGGTHRTRTVQNTQYGLMPDETSVRLDTLARCVGVGEWGNNDNRRWYRLFDHSSASDDVPDLGALSNSNPEIIRHDYLGVSREQDWTRFSVSQAGNFCVSVNRPAVTVRGNNGGDAQSIPNATRVYRERVSKTSMSLDFANDPAGAKAAWLANSEIVRVELPPGSSPTAFFSDGTDLPLEDTWHLYDGTIDGDNYGGFVGDQRRVVHHATYKEMTDRQFQSQRYVQIDGAGSHEYFATVVHGGTGSSGNGEYVLTISLGKCLPHSIMENGNGRSVPPPPQNLRAVQGKGTVELAWDAPDGAGVTGYRIERRPADGQGSGPQRSHGQPRDHHTLVEDTGSADTGYTDESAEQGVEYEYRVTARNEAGPGRGSDWVRSGPEPASNAPATGSPTIRGTAQVGQTLTADITGIADADGLSGVAYNYQWLADDTEIDGATGSTYTVQSSDNGKVFKVRITFTDDVGFSESLTSEATAVVMPRVVQTICDRTEQVRDAILAKLPDISDCSVVTDVELRGITELRLSDQNISALNAGDFGGLSGLEILELDGNELNSLPEDVFDGLASLETLDLSNNGLSELPEDIFDGLASLETLDLSNNDLSELPEDIFDGLSDLRYLDLSHNNLSALPAWPESVSNSPATGAPTISGTAQVGETLTADTSGIADADGLSGETFTYQWVSSDGTTDTDMENATGSTYTPVNADWGRSIKVRVTFTDGGGNEETLTSAPTEPVLGDGLPGAPRNLAATPGNKEVTLSWDPPADNGNAPATRYRIEWRVDGKDYKKGHWGTSGSTTYTKTDLANGVKYVFRVKAENGSGNSYGPYGPASEEVSATPTSGSAVDLGTPVLSNTKTLHHGMVRLDWQDIENAGWYVVQYYHVKSGEWLDLPAAGVDIAFHGSSAVVSNLHGLSWLRVRAVSCAGESEWSQIEELYGTNASDWEDMPVPEVAEGDQINPCPVILGTPVLSNTKTLHHGMVQLDWEDIEDAVWYVVQYYHVKSGEWLDLPAAGVDIAFHGSSAVASDLHGLSWLRVRAVSCAGESEWSQIEELYGTRASDWENVPVPDVAEGDEIEPCPEDVDTSDNSPATGLPTISGTAQVNETLTANTSGVADEDGLSNVQYEHQWLADDSEIAGATGLTYTLADTDEGKAIKVRVSFTDDAGNEETLTSAATNAVAAAPTTNSPATGAPTISGTAQVGETLTANTSGIADADGLGNVQYEYEWLADDAEIAGATGLTYTLTDSEESKAITVRVSFTDDAGNGETLTSAATEAAARPNSLATGAPTISGTVQVGETLTANTSGIADEDGLENAAFSYQWLADDSDISGATNATYTLADADEGKAVKVEVSFTDDADNEETLTSGATEAVAAAEPAEPPDKPRGLEATATHDSVTLTWDDPQDDSVTGYVILRRVRENDQGGEFSELVADTGTAAATYTDDTVAASTTYTYRIKATNGAGTSERSRWVHIDIPAAPVPDKPTGLSATATHDSVTLTWNDPGDDSITGYVILRRNRDTDDKGHFDELVADTGTAATTYTDNTVAAGTSYTYRIKAINGAGPGERSRWYHIDTPAAP